MYRSRAQVGRKKAVFVGFRAGERMAETLPALPLVVMEIGERAAQFARSSRAPATERF